VVEYVPARQPEHAPTPVAIPKLPTGHAVQAEAPVREYLPTEHISEHAAARPEAELYVPRAQSLHVAFPVEGWCDPGGQATHAVLAAKC